MEMVFWYLAHKYVITFCKFFNNPKIRIFYYCNIIQTLYVVNVLTPPSAMSTCRRDGYLLSKSDWFNAGDVALHLFYNNKNVY